MSKYKKNIIILLIFVFLGCMSVKVKPLSDLKKPKDIYEEGLKLVANRSYDDAIVYFENIIANYNTPKNEKFVSLSIYEIGFCYYKDGDEKLALTYFNRVLAESKTRRARVLASLLKNKIERGDGYKNASYN